MGYREDTERLEIKLKRAACLSKGDKVIYHPLSQSERDVLILGDVYTVSQVRIIPQNAVSDESCYYVPAEGTIGNVMFKITEKNIWEEFTHFDF